MDCLQAQNTISDALDRIPVDARELEAAKAHCRECKDCAAFVRALTLVKRAPLPAPAQDLPDRVMTSIRADAARQKAEREAEAAREAAAAAAIAETGHAESGMDASPDASGADGPEPLAARPPVRHISRRATVSAWSAAAAVFIVAVAVITVGAVRSISHPQVGELSVSSAKTGVSGSAPGASDHRLGAAVPQAGAPAAGGGTFGSAATASAPGYITVNGEVYRSNGPDPTPRSDLRTSGQTTTGFDGPNIVQREVLIGTGANRVFVPDDTGNLYSFDRVTRDYGGHTYGLMSADIAKFGDWPTLPEGIGEPTSPSGGPTFTLAGKDESGVTVYRLVTGSVEQGIAIAPGTGTGDPAAGDPNWTWWTLVR